jgi:MarR family transcriptional regulator, organic hydroperoxide resistance regulator
MDKTEAINEILSLQKRASNAVVGYAIDSWCKLDVPMAQFKSLFIIVYKEGANSRMLARHLGVTSGNVTGIVDRLVEQGLISRIPSPSDRRVIRLEATEKGRELLANLMEAQSRDMAHLLAHMCLEELTALFRGLTGLIRAIEEHREEAGSHKNGNISSQADSREE